MWKVRVKNMHRTAALLSLAAIFSASSASASVFILDSFDTPPISHVSSLASAPLPITNDNGPNLPAGANTRDLVGRGPLLGGGIAPAFGVNTTIAGGIISNILETGSDLTGVGGLASNPAPFIEWTLPVATDIGGLQFLTFNHTQGAGTVSVEADTGGGFAPVALNNTDLDSGASGNYGFSGGTLAGVTALRLTITNPGSTALPRITG